MSTSLREQLQATLEGRYTLGRELGGGGMLRVFLAEETTLGRHAVARLTEAFQLPGGLLSVSRAMLRVDPSWAPLRGHPGFERLSSGRD